MRMPSDGHVHTCHLPQALTKNTCSPCPHPRKRAGCPPLAIWKATSLQEVTSFGRGVGAIISWLGRGDVETVNTAYFWLVPGLEVKCRCSHWVSPLEGLVLLRLSLSYNVQRPPPTDGPATFWAVLKAGPTGRKQGRKLGMGIINVH